MALTIRLDSIGPNGHDVDEPLDTGWLAEALGKGAPFQPQGAGRVRVHVDRIDDAVRVSGRIQLSVVGNCSRCLERAALDLDSAVDITLFPLGGEPPAAHDGEVGAAHMGVATYNGEEIDLRDVVRDEVFLELPMNPLCSQKCAGLCSGCGANLNQGPCGCADRRATATLQGLEKFTNPPRD